MVWVPFLADDEDLLRLEADGSMTEGLADYPRSLAGVELAFLLTETSGSLCSACVLSRGRMSQLAQEFGGGHARPVRLSTAAAGRDSTRSEQC